MATFTRFLLKITANLIDKLCYYATCMDEPALNGSKKLWFLTLFKCALVNLLQNVVRSLLSARGPNDFGKMIILIIVYYKGGYHAVNNMKLLKNIRVNNMELIPTKVGCNCCNLPFPVGIKKETLLSPVTRICVFQHSVMTNFNCACPDIQRGQGFGFLSEGSSWLTACMSEQQRFWRDCADAQARLNLRCSHRR